MAENEVEKETKSRRGLVFLLGLVFLVIIGLVVGIIIVLNLGRESSVEDDSEVVEEDYSSEIDKITRTIEEKLKIADSPEEKVALYIEREGQIYNLIAGTDKGRQVKDIVSEANIDVWSIICSDAYEAEKLKPSAQTAIMIFDCENGRGNEEVANQYLEISGERAVSEGQAGGG